MIASQSVAPSQFDSGLATFYPSVHGQHLVVAHEVRHILLILAYATIEVAHIGITCYR